MTAIRSQDSVIPCAPCGFKFTTPTSWAPLFFAECTNTRERKDSWSPPLGLHVIQHQGSVQTARGIMAKQLRSNGSTTFTLASTSARWTPFLGIPAHESSHLIFGAASSFTALTFSALTAQSNI